MSWSSWHSVACDGAFVSIDWLLCAVLRSDSFLTSCCSLRTLTDCWSDDCVPLSKEAYSRCAQRWASSQLWGSFQLRQHRQACLRFWTFYSLSRGMTWLFLPLILAWIGLWFSKSCTAVILVPFIVLGSDWLSMSMKVRLCFVFQYSIVTFDSDFMAIAQILWMTILALLESFLSKLTSKPRLDS